LSAPSPNIWITRTLWGNPKAGPGSTQINKASRGPAG
jgi:hypothetical protein